MRWFKRINNGCFGVYRPLLTPLCVGAAAVIAESIGRGHSLVCTSAPRYSRYPRRIRETHLSVFSR